MNDEEQQRIGITSALQLVFPGRIKADCEGVLDDLEMLIAAGREVKFEVIVPKGRNSRVDTTVTFGS
jgi:hypothetical protein